MSGRLGGGGHVLRGRATSAEGTVGMLATVTGRDAVHRTVRSIVRPDVEASRVP